MEGHWREIESKQHIRGIMFKIAASRTSWFNQLELAGALEMNIDLQRSFPYSS